ncbi:MAG TPA: hypothetical protein VNB06_02890 [Thermoanaerobaculia bacterium]|nr:hypothetical protein [Thermoanaerobaculia bacterium]
MPLPVSLLSAGLAVLALVSAPPLGASTSTSIVPSGRFVSLGPGAAPVEQVLVHPGAGSLVFLLVPEPGNGPSRLYRSLDGGATWSAPQSGLPYLLPSGGAAFVSSRILVDPRYPNVAYLVRSHGGRSFGPRLFVYRSHDHGATWSAIHPGLDPLGVFGTLELFFPPSFPKIAWARNVAPGGTRLWRSFDAGMHWFPEPEHEELPAWALEPPPPLVRYRVVSTANSVERSDDGGLTWRRTGTTPTHPVTITAIVGGAPDGRVYVGSGDLVANLPAAGVFRSDDSGTTWDQVAPPDPVVRDLASAADIEDLVLAATGSGLYVSRDGAESWELARAGLGGPIADVALMTSASGSALLAGSWRSTDGGTTWSGVGGSDEARFANGVDGVYRILPEPDGAAATLWRSDDDGASWESLEVARCHAVAVLVEPQSPDDGNRAPRHDVRGAGSGAEFLNLALLAGAPQPLLCVELVGSPAELIVRRSDDRGETFLELARLLPAAGDEPVEIAGLRAARLPNGGVRIAVVVNRGLPNVGGTPWVATSGDGGAGWRTSTIGSGGATADGLLLARGGERILLATSAGVLASDDGGESWASANRGLELAGPITALAEVAATGELFAGATQSLYRSRDAGATWQRFDEGARGARVQAIEVDDEGTLLLLATSHGVLARRLAGGACVASEATLCLHDGAFRLEVAWEGLGAGTGTGRASPLTTDTGAFWFFDSQNVELVVKVLDGCALNGHQWVFATGLTDLATDLRVTRTAEGASRQYRRLIGERFRPVLDVEAFDCP